MTGEQQATAIASAVARRLASPAHVRDVPLYPDTRRAWWPQSLAKGAAGIALLHIARAHTGPGGWDTAQQWLAHTSSEPISAGGHSGLFYGVPAVTATVHTAGPGRYRRALAALDEQVAVVTRARIEQAHTRIDRRQLPPLAEFDLIYGLSGIAALLLRREPSGGLLREVLTYLVRLTEPLHVHGQVVPGWWTNLDPAGKPSPRFPAGHGNLGMAHGITGPLAVLSLAMRHGVTVPRQQDAIDRICRWLDTWRQQDQRGPWWPEWVTWAEQRRQQSQQTRPTRPSWCYGTPGLARAQQLAGLATGDQARQQMAERALLSCLTDPTQLAMITDPSVCHGLAGLLQTVWRCAADARDPRLADHLTPLLARLLTHYGKPDADQTAVSLLCPPIGDLGLMEGAAGVALVLDTITTPKAGSSHEATSPWDAYLALT